MLSWEKKRLFWSRHGFVCFCWRLQRLIRIPVRVHYNHLLQFSTTLLMLLTLKLLTWILILNIPPSSKHKKCFMRHLKKKKLFNLLAFTLLKLQKLTFDLQSRFVLNSLVDSEPTHEHGQIPLLLWTVFLLLSNPLIKK